MILNITFLKHKHTPTQTKLFWSEPRNCRQFSDFFFFSSSNRLTRRLGFSTHDVQTNHPDYKKKKSLMIKSGDWPSTMFSMSVPWSRTKSRLCKRAEQVINDPYGALRVAGFPLLLYFHCPTTVYLWLNEACMLSFNKHKINIDLSGLTCVLTAS